MSGHNLTRNFGGRMEAGWIQPACSCGWKGDKECAYNDYQQRNVREQQVAHMAKARSRNE